MYYLGLSGIGTYSSIILHSINFANVSLFVFFELINFKDCQDPFPYLRILFFAVLSILFTYWDWAHSDLGVVCWCWRPQNNKWESTRTNSTNVTPCSTSVQSQNILLIEHLPFLFCFFLYFLNFVVDKVTPPTETGNHKSRIVGRHTLGNVRKKSCVDINTAEHLY